ncbi:hypothetical protein B0H14DRAFT_3458844 [Mycena olivaceomarginata]|nr:hypothetical protein B0H14DRAFT_3458844 [Mycena olivaceomarginata]
MACAPKFFQGAKFKSVEDQDSSSQKSWYLVWDVGLFTSRTEAKAYLDNPSSQALTQHLRRSDALEKWGLLCGKHHQHDEYGETVPDSEPEQASEGEASCASTPARSRGAMQRRRYVDPQKSSGSDDSIVEIEQPYAFIRSSRAPPYPPPPNLIYGRIIKEESPPLRIKRESPPLQPSPLLQPLPPLQPSRSSSRVVRAMLTPDDTDYYFDSDSPDASPVSGAHVQSSAPRATTSTPAAPRTSSKTSGPAARSRTGAPGATITTPTMLAASTSSGTPAPARTSLKTPAPVVRAPPAASGNTCPRWYPCLEHQRPLILLGVLPRVYTPNPCCPCSPRCLWNTCPAPRFYLVRNKLAPTARPCSTPSGLTRAGSGAPVPAPHSTSSRKSAPATRPPFDTPGSTR